MRDWGWVRATWSIELRRAMSYRFDFWLDFLVSIGVQVGLAWFLWGAVLRARGTSEVGGWSLSALVLYTLLVPLVERMTRGHQMGFLSTEIYDGTLTRYLVFPVDLFVYKYAQHLAVSTVALAQFALVIGIYGVGWEVPEPFAVGPWTLARGLAATLVASAVYFGMASCLELVAYWADNVWSLLVMLRFGIRLLGGAMIPLALFPDSARLVLEWLPFASILSLPIRSFLGDVSGPEYARAMALGAVWALSFSALARWLHARGSRQYTAVGI